MSPLELKSNFHKLIDEFDNDEVLEMFYDAMADRIHEETKPDILDQLSPSQLERLKQGLQQSESGKTISHEEAMERINQWRIKVDCTRNPIS
ncbi:MAG TPA: hypothetical protein VE978_18310 [Chitinophagales bacterium]|nr:hypothetical protein [Chitinophagales bacterium]